MVCDHRREETVSGLIIIAGVRDGTAELDGLKRVCNVIELLEAGNERRHGADDAQVVIQFASAKGSACVVQGGERSKPADLPMGKTM